MLSASGKTIVPFDNLDSMPYSSSLYKRSSNTLLMRRPAGRPDGGQLAPLPHAHDVQTSKLKLDNSGVGCETSFCNLQQVKGRKWCPHHDPSPEKVVLKVASTSTTLRKQQDGTWAPSRKHSMIFNPMARKLITDFANTEAEVQAYCTFVICEMLTAGDLPPYPDYLEIATMGVRKTALRKGAHKAWAQQPFMDYDSCYSPIEAMAAIRAHASMSNIKDGHCNDATLLRWHPDRLISNEHLLTDKLYVGEDGKLPHRYLDIPYPVDGSKMFDVPPSENRIVQNRGYMAAYMLATHEWHSDLHEQAVTCLNDMSREGPFDFTFLTHFVKPIKGNTGHSFYPNKKPIVALAHILSYNKNTTPITNEIYEYFVANNQPTSVPAVKKMLVQRINKRLDDLFNINLQEFNELSETSHLAQASKHKT